MVKWVRFRGPSHEALHNKNFRADHRSEDACSWANPLSHVCWRRKTSKTLNTLRMVTPGWVHIKYRHPPPLPHSPPTWAHTIQALQRVMPSMWLLQTNRQMQKSSGIDLTVLILSNVGYTEIHDCSYFDRVAHLSSSSVLDERITGNGLGWFIIAIILEKKKSGGPIFGR